LVKEDRGGFVALEIDNEETERLLDSIFCTRGSEVAVRVSVSGTVTRAKARALLGSVLVIWRSMSLTYTPSIPLYFQGGNGS